MSDTSLEYVQWVEPTCPAGTAAANYTTTPVGIATVMLWRMEVRIPAGHQGYTGLALIDSGHFVVPYDEQGAEWLVGDNDLLGYDYGRQLGSNVKIATYNAGTYVHAWQVRLVYTPMSAVGLGASVIEAPARRPTRKAARA